MAHTSDTAVRQKDPMSVAASGRKELMRVSANRRKDPRLDSIARQKDPKVVSRARNPGASSATTMKSHASDDNIALTGKSPHPEPSRDERTSNLNTPARHASQAKPGAFAITGIESNNHHTENLNHEQPDEAVADSQQATPQAPIRAFAVSGNNGNDRKDELLRRHLVANAPLAEAFQDDPRRTDANPAIHKCSPGHLSRRT